ncbi:hypothetical protein AB6A40_010685 [Gnathostoma spinigerum]|uniref:RING-type domain-containing protein n=1 Tax=Gnathostoma spinigerum TaxID=75299 RepID=A0ABD6EVQ6_9BILA
MSSGGGIYHRSNSRSTLDSATDSFKCMGRSKAKKPTAQSKRLYQMSSNSTRSNTYFTSGLWRWEIISENCALCRNHLTDTCVQCLDKKSGRMNDECTVATGMCNHTFHFHCLCVWLEKQKICPLDKQEWDFQSFGH